MTVKTLAAQLRKRPAWAFSGPSAPEPDALRILASQLQFVLRELDSDQPPETPETVPSTSTSLFSYFWNSSNENTNEKWKKEAEQDKILVLTHLAGLRKLHLIGPLTEAMDISRLSELSTLIIEKMTVDKIVEWPSILSRLEHLSILHESQDIWQDMLLSEPVPCISFFMSHCNTTDIPSSFHQTFANLQSLSLLYGTLVYIPAAVQSLVHLTYLDLSHNHLESLQFSGSFANLKTLLLANNRIESLTGIHHSFPHLEMLDVSKNKLDEIIELRKLAALIRLKSLRIVDNGLTLKLELDGSLPSPAEVLVIKSNTAMTTFQKVTQRSDSERSIHQESPSSVDYSTPRLSTSMSSQRKQRREIWDEKPKEPPNIVPILLSASSKEIDSKLIEELLVSQTNQAEEVAHLREASFAPRYAERITIVEQEDQKRDLLDIYAEKYLKSLPSPESTKETSEKSKEADSIVEKLAPISVTANDTETTSRASPLPVKAPYKRYFDSKKTPEDPTVTSPVPDVIASSGSIENIRFAIPQKESSIRPFPVAISGSPKTGRYYKRPNKGIESLGTSPAPPLILSRPVTSSVTYNRVGASSKSSLKSVNSFWSATTKTSAVFSTFEDNFPSSFFDTIPRNPAIPYSQMTNSLHLFLKLKVFTNNAERPLFWIGTGLVHQLPPYVCELNGKLGTYVPGHLYGRLSSTSARFFTHEELNGLWPREIPAYFLMTNQSIYLFIPKFSIPFVPKDATNPYEEYIRQARDVVVYEDPFGHLTLVYTLPLSDIGKLDIGPCGQYLALHFLKAISGKDNGSQISPRPFSHHSQTPFISLCIMTRDAALTQHILDLIKEHSSVAVNNNDCWMANYLKEYIFLRKGRKRIVLNELDLAEQAKRVIEERKKAKDQSWLSAIIGGSSGIRRSVSGGLNVSYYIKEEDEDEHPDSYLYQSIGKVISYNVNRSPVVKTCALVSTQKYLYILSERVDIWPPIIFPSEAIANAEDLNASLFASMQLDKEKGFLCDLFSPSGENGLLRCGRMEDIVRVERWKSWRWGPQEQVKQIGGEISVYGSLIQNGCIGKCRFRPPHRSSKRPHDPISSLLDGAPEGLGTASGWSWWIRLSFELEGQKSWFWDLVFSSLTESTKLIEHIQKARGIHPEEWTEDIQPFAIEFVFGDD